MKNPVCRATPDGTILYIGDRVTVSGRCSTYHGTISDGDTGTVAWFGDNDEVGICFDNFVGGHDLARDAKCEDGHGWFFSWDDENHEYYWGGDVWKATLVFTEDTVPDVNADEFL